MLRILLSLPVLAACTPPPQEPAMRNPGPVSTIAPPAPAGSALTVADRPSAESIPAAESPLPARPTDSPLAAQGRRTLSTAFVRMGPGGHLTVELRDGRVLALRDVVMGPRDYCGLHVSADAPDAKYCGDYAEVAAARPSAGPQPAQPDAPASARLLPARAADPR